MVGGDTIMEVGDTVKEGVDTVMEVGSILCYRGREEILLWR